MPSKSSRAGDGRSGKKSRPTLAERADRHELYEEAVQCVEAEIDFVDETYQTLRGRKAKLLREDFCGTANTACEWVRRRKSNRAFGVDLDADVQRWGREHHVAKLPKPARQRIELLNDDVLKVRCERVDIVLAMNFSYWIFKDRRTMRRYFKRVRSGLAPGGLFMLDAYGGSDAHQELKERTKLDGFTYVWDQNAFNPITGELICHIHFNFPDGSRLNKAFSYDWRLWTVPEIREILIEAGFARATVYWQGTEEETGEGNGEFLPTERGEADPAFIVYIVAEP